MYSGISQAQLAKELYISEASYSRKENGKIPFARHEAVKAAKILNLNERVILKYWMADKIHDLMKGDKELVYDALKIVEAHYDDYDDCIEVPQYNKSFSTLKERKQRKKKFF